MNSVCEKIRRVMPDFPDCNYPWEVLDEMRKKRHICLARREVDGLDDAEVYAADSVKIQPYCLFSGLVILDEGVLIGPYSFLRGPIYIGRCSLVGPHAEVIRCLVMDNTSLSHKSLMGDAIFGNNINFGGMSMVCNIPVGRNFIKAKYKDETVEREGKYGGFVGDNSSLGCLTMLMPGSYVSENSNIFGHCIVYGKGNVKYFANGIPDIRVG